jgi:hypothetical protein
MLFLYNRPALPMVPMVYMVLATIDGLHGLEHVHLFALQLQVLCMVFMVLNCPLSMVFSVDLPPVHGIHGGGIHGPSAWPYSRGRPIIIGDYPPPQSPITIGPWWD